MLVLTDLSFLVDHHNAFPTLDLFKLPHFEEEWELTLLFQSIFYKNHDQPRSHLIFGVHVLCCVIAGLVWRFSADPVGCPGSLLAVVLPW